MHAMIVDLDASRLEHSQIAFLETGIHVTGSGSFAVAETCLRRAVVDAALTTLAQRRNPRLVTLMLTPDVAGTTDLYSDAVSSLHCVLDGDVAPRMVARMAQASLAGRAACRLTPAQAERAPQTPVQDPQRPQPVFTTTRRKPASTAIPA
jgi:hypothetical protein